MQSEDTAGGYVTCARKFFKWLSKKGTNTMNIPILTEPTDKSSENEETTAADMATVNETENEAVQETPKAKGRPKKSETEKSNREQISLYVDKDIYSKLKEIAIFKNMTVSDILCISMRNIVEKNYEKIQRIRQAIESENLEI